MSEPLVTSLIYRFVVEKPLEYQDPAPVSWDMPGVFRACLENGFLRVDLTERHTTIESARDRIKPYLRAWEIDAEIKKAARIRFEYTSAELIAPAPSPTGAHKVTEVSVRDSLVLLDNSRVHRLISADPALVSPEYPSPPAGFQASQLVETLWALYEMYLQGRVRLTDMGYYCYSAIVTDAKGGNKQAAQRFGVSRNVLVKLKVLCSEVGDLENVRKITPRTQLRTHTEQERLWIEHVVRVLIRRAGQYAAEPTATRPEITLASLPKLDR